MTSLEYIYTLYDLMGELNTIQKMLNICDENMAYDDMYAEENEGNVLCPKSTKKRNLEELALYEEQKVLISKLTNLVANFSSHNRLCVKNSNKIVNGLAPH